MNPWFSDFALFHMQFSANVSLISLSCYTFSENSSFLDLRKIKTALPKEVSEEHRPFENEDFESFKITSPTLFWIFFEIFFCNDTVMLLSIWKLSVNFFNSFVVELWPKMSFLDIFFHLTWGQNWPWNKKYCIKKIYRQLLCSPTIQEHTCKVWCKNI